MVALTAWAIYRRAAQATSNRLAAAQSVVQALNKVKAGTQVGVNYQQYGLLVIEAKAAMNNVEAALPAGELKQSLNQAIDAYADAGRYWGASINGMIYESSDVGQMLRVKYKIEGDSYYAFSDRNKVLTVIWLVGEINLDKATTLTRQ
ncbi:MAG: hypothetical protein AB7O81_30280 [Blastocatellales bacterium]